VTTEGDRVAGFGRLEDGLRQASPWYMWGPYVSERQYYHGDNAAGLGASHQTGWTELIADVIRRRHGAVRETVDLIGDLIDPLE
jgi:hypothetical protein